MAEKKRVGNVLSDNELKKRYNTGKASNICLTTESMLWLPSRVLSLNHQMGGGILYGTILELFGEESTGKSLLCKDFGVSAQALGGVVLWGDAEGTFNGPWAQQNGLDLDRTYLLPENCDIETHADWQADMIVTLRSKLVHNEPILLVEDSIGALDTLDNSNAAHADGKAEMAQRAKAIYKMVRQRNSFYLKYGVSVIYINQLRKKMGASQFENPDTTVGGGAMKFFASQRLGLYRGKLIKNDDKKKVGRVNYVRTEKNKVAPPRENTKAQVYFSPDNPTGVVGYSKYYGLITEDGDGVLEEMGILVRKAGAYYYKGNQIAKGYNAMMRKIQEDDTLRKNLIRRAGINTISKTRAQLESITENRYPVKTKKSKDGEEA